MAETVLMRRRRRRVVVGWSSDQKSCWCCLWFRGAGVVEAGFETLMGRACIRRSVVFLRAVGAVGKRDRRGETYMSIR